jgi:hypothetical protein
MPRGFCGGAGAVQNLLSFFVSSFRFFLAHLASRVLNGAVQFIDERIHTSIQVAVGDFLASSRFVGCGHFWSFLRWAFALGHKVYPTLSNLVQAGNRLPTTFDSRIEHPDGLKIAIFPALPIWRERPITPFLCAALASA